MMYWLAFLETYSVIKLDSLIELVGLVDVVLDMIGLGCIISKNEDYFGDEREFTLELSLKLEGLVNDL